MEHPLHLHTLELLGAYVMCIIKITREISFLLEAENVSLWAILMDKKDGECMT